METSRLKPARVQVAPGEVSVEPSRSSKKALLRLFMKEREGVVSRLIELDYSIWVLEEFFRTGGRNEPLEAGPMTKVEGLAFTASIAFAGAGAAFNAGQPWPVALLLASAGGAYVCWLTRHLRVWDDEPV